MAKLSKKTDLSTINPQAALDKKSDILYGGKCMKALRQYRIDHLEKLASKEDRTTHIHVTDLSQCLSGVYFQKTGAARPDISESKLRRFDAGNIIEERVVAACEEAKVLHSTQGLLEWPEYNMVGNYDLIIEEDGQLWLIEVKSIHPYGMSHLYKSNKPHEHYVEQCNLYLSKLKEQYPDIKCRLYYEALDGRTAEFEISYDTEVVAKALEKARILHEALASKTPPEPPETFIQENGKWQLNWRVKYCIQAGIHQKCDPMNVLHPDPETWVRKLEYQAKKRNQ